MFLNSLANPANLHEKNHEDLSQIVFRREQAYIKQSQKRVIAEVGTPSTIQRRKQLPRVQSPHQDRRATHKQTPISCLRPEMATQPLYADSSNNHYLDEQGSLQVF